MFPPYLMICASLAILARDAFRVSVRLARVMVPGVLALILAIGMFALATYETTYTDASGARCAAFRITSEREADMCTGLFDRSGLGMLPSYPVDASIGGAK